MEHTNTTGASIVLRRITSRTPRYESACLIDKAHNELFDIYEDNYSEFFHLLHEDLRIDLKINRDQPIQDDVLHDIDMFLIGCPKKAMINPEDIDTIVKYVREGGSLLVITDAGGDSANETNLNDLVSAFNIDIESTTVKDTRNVGSSAAPVLERINLGHEIAKNASRIVMGSAATLCIQEPATGIAFTNRTSVVEQYSPNEKDGWKVLKVGENFPVVASVIHGQGKVVVFGDVDMFSNDKDYGLNAFDNAAFVRNACNWLLSPVEVSTIIDWLVSKMTALEEVLHLVKGKCDLLSAENEKLRMQVKELRQTRDDYLFLKDDLRE